MTVYIYHYDHITGVFAGTTQATMSPLEPDVPIVPAYATTIAPPSGQTATMKAVFAAGTWTLVADHRGETWYDADSNPVIVGALGDPSIGGLSATPPPPTPALLRAHAASVRAIAANGSATINVGNNRLIPSWVDAESRGSILGLVVASQQVPSLTTVWKGADGAYYSLDATEMLALSMGIMTFVEKCFAAEAQIDTMIDAGTVKANAEVDAVFGSLML